MCHELTRQICSYHLHVVLIEMEVKSYPMHNTFQPSVGAEIPLTWREQQLPCGVLKAEHHKGNDGCHYDNPEEHSAEYFKMSSESEKAVIVSSIIVYLRIVFAQLIRFLLCVLPRCLHSFALVFLL